MKKAIYDARYERVIHQLSARRRALGMDQRTVAAKLDHTNKWLLGVERMNIRIDVCQLVDLCRVLKLDASRLVRRMAEESAGEDAPPFSYRTSAFHSGTVRAAA